MTSLPSAADTPAVHRPVASLSADEARRIALRAQGFLGAPDRRAGVRGV
ncbi:winged helix-turn-helix domain-containing protein, partial [Streptomyces albidoflavus]